jgi:hypothetical protein
MPTHDLPWWRTEVGWCAVLGLLPVVHGIVHLAEQWSAFGGRIAWLMRMRATSSGPPVALLELAVVSGYVAWLVLQVRALRRGPLTVDGESVLARAHASVARPAGLLTATLASLHALLLWLPRALGRASHLESYEILRTATGTWPWLAASALGLSAFVLHVAAGPPTSLAVLGLARTPESRQAARLVSTGLAVCLLVLAAQLVGWHATGTGTVWPVRVVAPDESAPLDE